MELAVVRRQGFRELHITLWPLPGERPSVLLWRLDTALREHQATVVKQDIFGSLDVQAETLGRMARLFGEIRWPVLWVEGQSCAGSSIAGMQVLAVAGTAVEPVRLDGRIVGSTFQDAFARHCYLADVRPADVSVSNEAQARQVFENIEAGLERTGMKMAHLVRTWLFLNDILSWYGPFNEVRRRFFEKRGLLGHLVPASTGVGVRNPANAALVAGAWAVQPTSPSLSLCEVSSPRQCPAPDYGSCFSRAVELGTPDLCRLLISGTASIEPGGRSTRGGDMRGQINLTMGVIEAILAARELRFSDVTRGIAYFRNAQDAGLFAEWCAEHRTALPLLGTQAFVCRDELLFEIELDAISVNPSTLGPPALSEGRTAFGRKSRRAKPH